MRKSFFTIAIAGLMLMTSCDITDIKPTHLLDQGNALRSVDDYERALFSAYATLRSVGLYGRNLTVLPDMMTDNLSESVESLGNYRNNVDWYYTADDAELAATWSAAYTAISRANLVINGAPGVPGNAAKRDRIIGEALALRGLMHFEILRCYGQSYERNSTALGAAISTQITDATFKPSRATVAQTYDQIFADLKGALPLVTGKTFPNSTTPAYLNRTAILGLIARAHLYSAEYDSAAKYAQDAITAKGNPSLATTSATFRDIWRRANNNEILFNVVFATPSEGRIGDEVYFTPNNRQSFAPSQSILDLLPTTDVRRAAYFSTTIAGRALTNIKYLGQNSDGVSDATVLRLSEMHLILAEVQGRIPSGNIVNGAGSLNLVRLARNAARPAINSQSDLLDAVQIERRREFYLEGHRWFDLRRFNNGNGNGIRRPCPAPAPATACELPANSFRWVWPIPIGELNANPNIQQNANY